MINILIVEDNLPVVRTIEKIILNKDSSFSVKKANSADEALIFLKQDIDFHMFWLDINLSNTHCPNHAGFDFALLIRQTPRYIFTPIIFITSLADMELDAYRKVHCHLFLVKPFKKIEIDRILDRLLRSLPSPPSNDLKKWLIRKNGVYYSLMVKDMIYIESTRRGINIHMKNEVFPAPYQTMTDTVAELGPLGFIRCHRSFLINTQYLCNVDLTNQTLTLHADGDNISIAIGKTYIPAIKEWMNGEIIQES